MSTNEPMSEERLDAIQGWVDRATKGRWHLEQEYDDEGSPYGLVSVREENGLLRHIPVAEGIDRRRDAEFIAHAREDIPALLAEVERLRDELAKAREITSEKVERAAQQIWGGVALFRHPGDLPSTDSVDASDAGAGRRYRRAARAALEAAMDTALDTGEDE